VFPERLAGGTVSPAEVAEIRDFMRSQRTTEAPFDIAVGGYSDRTLEYEEQFGAYERNGLTWWFERFDPSRGLSLHETRELVAAGPAREPTTPGASASPHAEEKVGVPPSAA
jgi:hypothetical protein